MTSDETPRSETLDLGALDVDEAALWYSTYPRKADRRRAVAAFARARKVASFEQIMSATAALAESVRGKPAAEVPYAVSFLRAEPWRPAAPPVMPPASIRRRRADQSRPRRLRTATRVQPLTVEQQKAKWCREHGITVAEYERRKGDPTWIEMMKRRG